MATLTAPQGTLLLLHIGIERADLPTEPGFGSGSTCRNRMLKWAEGGVGQFLDGVMLAESHVADRIDPIGARPARNTKSPSAAQVTRWSWRSAPANPDARGGGPL